MGKSTGRNRKERQKSEILLRRLGFIPDEAPDLNDNQGGEEASQDQVAEFIAEMALSLRDLANEAGLDGLADDLDAISRKAANDIYKRETS